MIKSILRKIQSKGMSILLGVFLSLFLNSCQSSAQNVSEVSVSDFETGIAQENVQLLDVRTASEYQSGHRL